MSREKDVRQNRLKGVLIRSGMGITKWHRKLHKTNGMEQFRWQVGVESGVFGFGKGEKGNNRRTE